MYRSAGIILSTFLLMYLTSDRPAYGQERSLESLLQCDKIEDEADRLACFNAVVEALKVDRKESAVQAFGKNGKEAKPLKKRKREFAELPKERRKEFDDIPKEITATIAKYWKSAIGTHHFLLDNGQIWRAKPSEGVSVPSNPKTVRIKRSGFGGYRLEAKGQTRGRTGKAKRIY